MIKKHTSNTTIIKNADGTVSIQNKRIKVTLPIDEYDSFEARAVELSRKTISYGNQSPVDAVQRGLVINAAMVKLANKSELRRAVRDARDGDVRFRKERAELGSWKIELIGELPDQIGFSNVDNLKKKVKN